MLEKITGGGGLTDGARAPEQVTRCTHSRGLFLIALLISYVTFYRIPSTSSRTLEEELKVARRLGLEGAPCAAVFEQCDNIIINKLAN